VSGSARRTPILPVVALAGATAAATLLPAGSFATRSNSSHFAFEGLIAGGTIAVAILAISRYRDIGDAHPLMVSVGFAALAIQNLIFGIAAPIADPWPWDGFAFPSHAWQVGWLVAAGCFALGGRIGRWTDPGRVREATVALGALLALAGLDLVLVLGRRSLSALSDTALVDDDPAAFSLSSPLHWILMLLTTGLLLLAAWFEHRARPSPKSAHPWLAAAYVVAAAAQLPFAALPTQYRPLVQPADFLPPTAVALAFAGFVTAGRARASSLRVEAEQAREVQSGRAQIASMISHELKNPIMSIKGLASTGSRMYASMSDDERLEFFGLIDEEAGHLKALVDETATALKVDAGTLAYSFGRADVGELVREAAWKSPHGEHPLVVETEPGVTVSCDRLRLSEVIEHLLDNAAKFSPAEEPIEVRTYRSDGTAVIEVTDRGPGIPPERREDVFEKFARYRPRGYEELPGSGLGLYICRAHVIAHGGRISVEDPPGSGTMLRVTLPEERKEP